MTFDEWLEAYFSGTQIDDVVTGMMRTAFEAGKSCNDTYNEQHELLGIASELCYRMEADMPTLRDKFAMAAMQGFCANRIYHHRQSWGEDIASDAYIVADAMLKERMK